MPVIDVQHPLVKHKVGLLREEGISTKKFRELTHELAMLLAYEATADFPLEPATIACWSGPTEVQRISGRKVTVVPILRAGLGMLDGVLDMVPSAKVSVVGLSRNHETLQPENYFEKFVGHLDERTAIIIDPMLATGGSLVHTVALLTARNAPVPILVVCALAAPEGIQRLRDEGLDLHVITAAIDDELNDHAFIVPGLGDAGDRQFGSGG